MEGLKMMIMNWTINENGHLISGWNVLPEGEQVMADTKRIVVYICGKGTCLKATETSWKKAKNALVAIA